MELIIGRLLPQSPLMGGPRVAAQDRTPAPRLASSRPDRLLPEHSASSVAFVRHAAEQGSTGVCVSSASSHLGCEQARGGERLHGQPVPVGEGLPRAGLLTHAHWALRVECRASSCLCLGVEMREGCPPLPQRAWRSLPDPTSPCLTFLVQVCSPTRTGPCTLNAVGLLPV